jgi:hypothetical protein
MTSAPAPAPASTSASREADGPVTGGQRAADLLGRRRVFMVSVTVCAIVSVLGTVAPTGGLLIAARLVKGIAAGFPPRSWPWCFR